MKILNEVMTTAEAAQRWGLSEVTIKKPALGKRDTHLDLQKTNAVDQGRGCG